MIHLSKTCDAILCAKARSRLWTPVDLYINSAEQGPTLHFVAVKDRVPEAVAASGLGAEALEDRLRTADAFRRFYCLRPDDELAALPAPANDLARTVHLGTALGELFSAVSNPVRVEI